MNKQLLCVLLFSFWLAGCSTVANQPTVAAPVADTEALKVSAAQLYSQKQWSASYSSYLALAEQQPESAETWFRLGVSAYRLDKLAEAERSFERVIIIDRRHRKALFNLALLNLGKGTLYLDKYLQSTPPKKRDPELEKILDDLQSFAQ
nr:tetratricopeptide repeat protein [Aliamphritea spongicola]